METTPAFSHLACLDCGRAHDPPTARCPDCGGALDARYAFDDPRPAEFTDGRGIERYAAVLPIPAGRLVTAGEGSTPLVELPGLADELGIGALYVKQEGQNPTGAACDRGIALAVSAARERGASEVALPTMGNGGQSAAAYAARAGLASTAFVPSRTPFVNKAMTNVHGGEMSVVEGRYADALAAFDGASADAEWDSLAPFDTPYRHEGAKTLAYELATQLAWSTPDAVVCPTGHGTAVVGLEKGGRELRDLGLAGAEPHLYAVQASGCAPVAQAWENGTEVTPVAHPDTICGPLEIPDPAGGEYVLEALDRTDGGAVAVDDEAILASAVALAEAGITAGATGGAGLAGLRTLAADGAVGSGDTVVLVDPTSGNKEADLLRSHLMSRGR